MQTDTIKTILGHEYKVIRNSDGETLYMERLTDYNPSLFFTADTWLQQDYTYKVSSTNLTVDVVLTRECVLPYPERNRAEAKLGDELKAAASRINEIYMFDRHPSFQERKPDNLLGRVKDIRWNERSRTVIGRANFVLKKLKRYPHLHDALRGKKPFPVSIGQYNHFGPPGALNGKRYGASQVGILFDHLAVLTRGERPRCELGQCGLNVKDTRISLDRRIDELSDKICPNLKLLKNKDNVKVLHEHLSELNAKKSRVP